VAKYVIRLTKVQREIEGKRGDERVRGDEENPTRVDRLRSLAITRSARARLSANARRASASVLVLTPFSRGQPPCTSLPCSHYPLSTGDADISRIPENPDSEVEPPM
jgi:hypothetical protein